MYHLLAEWVYMIVCHGSMFSMCPCIGMCGILLPTTIAGISGAEGTFRLRFYDVFGEDWVTEPMSLNVTCTELTDELVSIPNDAIAEGTVDCEHRIDTNVAKYNVVFTGNPGYLKVRFFDFGVIFGSSYDRAGGVYFGPFLHESNNDCLNVLVTDEYLSFILLSTVFTRVQAHRECLRSPDTPTSPFFRGITPPSPIILSILHGISTYCASP